MKSALNSSTALTFLGQVRAAKAEKPPQTKLTRQAVRKMEREYEKKREAVQRNLPKTQRATRLATVQHRRKLTEGLPRVEMG